MGDSSTTADDLVAFFKKYGKEYPAAYEKEIDLKKFCEKYCEEAKKAGVRVEVAFCQAMLETGYLKFSENGKVKANQFNFAGIGAINKDAEGERFASVQEGIWAHVQILKGFATTEKRSEKAEKIFKIAKKGCAPNVEDLTGTWAIDRKYDEKLKDLMTKLEEVKRQRRAQPNNQNSQQPDKSKQQPDSQKPQPDKSKQQTNSQKSQPDKSKQQPNNQKPQPDKSKQQPNNQKPQPDKSKQQTNKQKN